MPGILYEAIIAQKYTIAFICNFLAGQVLAAEDETITIERNAIILNMNKQKIEEAASFAADEWHRFMEQEFRDEIHDYYGKKQDEMKYPRY